MKLIIIIILTNFWFTSSMATRLPELQKTGLRSSMPSENKLIKRLQKKLNKEVVKEAAKEEGLKGNKLNQFMAQVKHESADFTKFEEDHYYSSLEALRNVPFAKAQDMTQAEYEELYSAPTRKERREKFFNTFYSDREDLGNTEEGDGYKYRGSGAIQLTGKHNFEKYAEGYDAQDLADNLSLGAKMSARYFKDVTKNLPENASTDKYTRIINKHTNTYSKRRKAYKDITMEDYADRAREAMKRHGVVKPVEELSDEELYEQIMIEQSKIKDMK